MSFQRTINRQDLLEQLAGVVSLHGWKDFEVSLYANELRVEKRGGAAACVVMLPGPPTFQAHLTLATLGVTAISFSIGEQAARQATPAAMTRFADVDEAARWLLKSLETTRGSG